jgi:hypothetical protein
MMAQMNSQTNIPTDCQLQITLSPKSCLLTGTVDEQRSSTESLNGPEGDRGGADVDKGGDQRDQERVGDCAECLEEGGTEVEDEVDTGPLL